MCADKSETSAKCGYISFRYKNTIIKKLCIFFSVITNWIWLYEPHRFLFQKFNNSLFTQAPTLIQFDGDTKLGGKLAKMRSLGFYFLNSEKETCNANAVQVNAY